MKNKISRRRAIAITAVAAGLPLLLRARRAEAKPVRWEGSALGAQATLTLYHDDEAAARRAVSAAVAEVERLEKVFSLFRADSAISALNRDGSLDAAPAELVELLSEARGYAELTGGSFDFTVQPLWQLYFRHFTQPNPDPAGPSAAEIAAARALIDWRGVVVDGASIRFAKPGQGVSLNGIAQGYITDRVTTLLRRHGLERMLVDMGEPRALSTKPDGSAWRIGIADPRAAERVLTSVDVVDKAVATSGGYGTIFDSAGRFTHLIDPSTGLTAPAAASVTVIADTAARADALSTALSVAAPERRAGIVAAAGVSALLVGQDGAMVRLGA